MYERTQSIERQESVSDTGRVSGVLATDGEASDGHILDIAGGRLKDGAPLLFNHDAFDGNLGSWTKFTKTDHEIRGDAQIEIDGRGEKSEWRKDVAHMVGKGHIGSFSIRWEETKEPVRRVNLSKDHPAFVDGEKETDFAKLYGYYFPEWRLMEGSIVTLPADQAALIGRMRSGPGHWQRILQRMARIQERAGDVKADVEKMLTAFDQFRLDELEPVTLTDGRTFYVPSELLDEESEDDLSTDRHDDGAEEEGATDDASATDEVASVTPDLERMSREDVVQAMRDELVPAYSTVREEFAEIGDLYRTEFRSMYRELREEWRDTLYQALGRVKQ